MTKKIFLPTDILIPNNNIDMSKWSVVACDQYTSDTSYWEKVENFVGCNPSSLKITLPEVYLDEDNLDNRIENINKEMNSYISDNIFKTIKNSYVYTERTLKNGKTRKGIIGVLDLEEYDFNLNSGTPIRATEGTVISRIPPRVHIREKAPLELPHIMVLIDDEQKTVIEPLSENKASLEKIYDFELMQDGGHAVGYNLDGNSSLAKSLNDAIEKLGNIEIFENKYNISNKPVLQFAMGDGNHSLATAKTCWENLKKKNPSISPEHPSRYALIELVNLHDTSLEFKPIHRVLFNVAPDKVISEIKKFFADISITEKSTKLPTRAHHFTILIDNKEFFAIIKNPNCNLSVGSLQQFIDFYISSFGGKADYIHGDDVVRQHSKNNNVGFLLPNMEKSELFKTVITDGVLPRKTFSMGHANEKRFYLEARKIIY